MPIDLKSKILENWKDDSGYIRLSENPPAGSGEANATLYSSQFYMFCEILGMLRNEDVERFSKNYRDCVVKTEDGMYIYGLTHRHPKMTDMLDSHDNQVGILACAALLGNTELGSITTDMYEWGQKHQVKVPMKILDWIKWKWLRVFLSWFKCYWYNNLKPEEFRIEAMRQGSVTAFIDICAGKNPGILNKLWLIGGVLCSIWDKNTSTKILSWMQLKVLADKDWMFGLTKLIFDRFVNMDEVVKGYFGDRPLGDLFAESLR